MHKKLTYKTHLLQIHCKLGLPRVSEKNVSALIFE